jgi:hypothetical protein
MGASLVFLGWLHFFNHVINFVPIYIHVFAFIIVAKIIAIVISEDGSYVSICEISEKCI